MGNKIDLKLIFITVLFLTLLNQAQNTDAPAEIMIQLKTNPTLLGPDGPLWEKIPPHPIYLEINSYKPPQIIKEPDYDSIPGYAVFRLGNGPNAEYVLAVDQPIEGVHKYYIDKNRNGDLTDDGNGLWQREARVPGEPGAIIRGPDSHTLQASYEAADGESSTREYGLIFKCSSQRVYDYHPISIWRQTAMTGTAAFGGKEYSVLLIEDDSDAVFNKKIIPRQDPPPSPAWLFVDLNNNGEYEYRGGERYDLRRPFEIKGIVYEAEVAADGSWLNLKPSQSAVVKDEVLVEGPEPAIPPPLPIGTVAPDFTAEAWGGGQVRLSDFPGKIVILDFWATWCGPCLRAMPHLEDIFQSVKDHGVMILAVSTGDKRAAFKDWVSFQEGKFSFTIAYDPTLIPEDSIARKLYNVAVIPTTFVIDQTGKIVESFIGYESDDTRIERALERLGIRIK